MQIIVLPDGSHGALIRSMTYGDVVLILILVPILWLLIYTLWQQRRTTR